ncbi:unnamed protein product [Trichobilharzia regenti]|nr:unnamed protein product [Trichobilharzia regenti]
MLKTTSSLKQLLIRCAIDYTSNAFMTKEECLMALSDATKFGSEHRIDAASQLFQVIYPLLFQFYILWLLLFLLRVDHGLISVREVGVS